jgi:hypothetical protein
MADDDLTTDEQLRALAALEAIAAGDDVALTVLAAPGERPLPALLSAYGQDSLHRLLIAAFKIGPDTSDADRAERLAELNNDQQARLVFILINSLHQFADYARDDLAAAKAIGQTVLDVMGLLTAHDTAVILLVMRQQVLQRA